MRFIQIPRRFVRHRWGGTETVILQTSRRLRGRGHDCHIYCPAALSVPGTETIEGVPVHRSSYFYPWLGLDDTAREQLDLKGGNLFSFSLMRALSAVDQPDLLHLHTRKRLGGIVRHVAGNADLPYILSLHGGLLDVPAEELSTYTEPVRGALEWGRLLGWWYGSRAVERDAAAIITLGVKERRAIQAEFPDTRVELLPNGVDTSAFSRGDGVAFRARFDIPSDARILLNVGRIDPQKNQLQAVQCLAQLLSTHPKLHLVLLGHVTDPVYCEQLRAIIVRKGLGTKVTVIEGLDPGSPHLVGAYHAAEVFLLPSIHEPFGIVILEAWASSLPVVATAVGGVPDLIEDGRTGLLADSKDLTTLVRHCRTLLDDNELRVTMGGRGRRRALRHYDWERITERLLKIYAEVIDEHKSRGSRTWPGRWTLGLKRSSRRARGTARGGHHAR